MREELTKLFGISAQQLKIFFLAFLAMFIITSLQYLGVRSPIKPFKLVMPIPPATQNSDTVEMIKPKLEKKPSTFSLIDNNVNTVFVPQTYAADDMEQLSAYAVVDLDTGKIIKSKNSQERLPIASITKIMTAIVGLDLADPSELFTVDAKAAAMEPTKINIVPGEKMTFQELLHASLLTSANDATEQIKNSIDTKYKQNVFIDAMNMKAAFLGLNDTHFANAEGFDSPDNYSSAEDLARLAEYALTNYPLFTEIVNKDFDVIRSNENHKQFALYNWNGLIGVYPDVHGVKIGNTEAAGKTTLVYATRGGKRLVVVILGAPNIKERDLMAAKLLDVGYEQTLGLSPINVKEAQLIAKYSTWQYKN